MDKLSVNILNKIAYDKLRGNPINDIKRYRGCSGCFFEE